MTCRISLLLGRPPSEVRALPMSDVDLLTRYWADEPWGPMRDNLHAAMVAAAVGNFGPRKLKRALKPKDFMLRPRHQVQTENRGSLLAALRMMARKKPAAASPTAPPAPPPAGTAMPSPADPDAASTPTEHDHD